MANLTQEQIQSAGKTFAVLRRALQKSSLADLQNANVFPLRGITIYNNEANTRHVLSDKDEKAISDFYNLFTVEEWKSNFGIPLTIEQQGVFNIAYAHEMASERK